MRSPIKSARCLNGAEQEDGTVMADSGRCDTLSDLSDLDRIQTTRTGNM